MSSATICIMITIFVYLVGMLLIGFHYAKKNESSSDFYLGGRKLGPLVTAMSAEASDMSSYLLMGWPGLSLRPGRRRLDGHRPCRRYVSQLALHGKAAAPLYPHHRLLHPAPVLLPPLPG